MPRCRAISLLILSNALPVSWTRSISAGNVGRSRRSSPTLPTLPLGTVSRPSRRLLSDINMPGMSGLDLLPKAKAARPDVPVIMITAYGDADTRRKAQGTRHKALANGADAFLTKPIDFAIVRDEIDMRVGHTAGSQLS